MLQTVLLIAYRTQKGPFSEHPTAKHQQCGNRISQPLRGTKEQIKSLNAASSDNTLVPVGLPEVILLLHGMLTWACTSNKFQLYHTERYCSLHVVK